MTVQTTQATHAAPAYLPDVAITAILKNPANPRHRAVADEDQVDVA